MVTKMQKSMYIVEPDLFHSGSVKDHKVLF